MASHLFYGLINGGATCWLNATYQSLISLDPLMEVLFRHALAMDSARLVLAYDIGSRLVAKFFGFGSYVSQIGAILPRIDAGTREQYVRLVSIIDSLSNPESFYASAALKEWAGLRSAGTGAPAHLFPIATCALINYGRNNASVLATNPEIRADSALRLFGALVIYCGATDARPVPEYHSIGEVGPAMLETIIGSLCWEHGNVAVAREIRSVFGIHINSSCLCVGHAIRASELLFADDTVAANAAQPQSEQMCIQVTLPSFAPGEDASIAREAFIANVQASVDICEKNCSSAGCNVPSIMGIETRRKFGPVIAIMTDDSVARGLISPSVTSVYRRSPIGTLCVPREMTLVSDDHLVSYRLVAQIIQEGGHFTAIVSRNDEGGVAKHAYASDRHVSPLQDIMISPGCCVLFYTLLHRDDGARTSAADIFSRAICRSMRGYIALNNRLHVIPSSGMTPQPLQAPQNIADLSRDTIAPFKDFYFAAMGIHITLALRSAACCTPRNLEALFANRVGAQFCILLSQIACGRNDHMFEENDFAIWKFYTSDTMRNILAGDEGDHLREEIKRRMRTVANPLQGLETAQSVLAHSRRDAIIGLIRAYQPRTIAEVATSAKRSIITGAPVAPTPTASAMQSSPVPAVAPMVIHGEIGIVHARPTASAAPISAFPRRKSIQARYERPQYITPEMALAYERYRCQQ